MDKQSSSPDGRSPALAEPLAPRIGSRGQRLRRRAFGLRRSVATARRSLLRRATTTRYAITRGAFTIRYALARRVSTIRFAITHRATTIRYTYTWRRTMLRYAVIRRASGTRHAVSRRAFAIRRDVTSWAAVVGHSLAVPWRGLAAAGAGLRRVGGRSAAATRRMRAVPGRWRSAQVAAARTRAAARDETAQARAAAREATARARAAVREEAERARAAARDAARVALTVRQDQAREEAARAATERRRADRRKRIGRLIAKDRARRVRRFRLLVAAILSPMVAATGLAAMAFFVDSIPGVNDVSLPESTTIYYADGTTPIARIGAENRTVLAFDDMNDAVRQAIVAAEDRTFWANSGLDLASIGRAAWNNLNGGQLQGGSTITQQYARISAGLKGITYARKTREAILAWKIDRQYTKQQILEFYANTVAFGRGAYGVEAAAEAYFGKTARRNAPADQQVSVAEAMVLASVLKQPEPDPQDPAGHPGYDPARGGVAAANAAQRWDYVRQGMVELGYLSPDQAAALEYPHTVRALPAGGPSDGPNGLVVSHVLSELRLSAPFAGQGPDYIRNGGFRIVTTIDQRAQRAAQSAADIRGPSAPPELRGQPDDWQAALVAVEPGTGRVLAYYGGSQGSGADFAGWYYDDNGTPTGYGQHPPGSSFKVYDLAEALRQGIPLSSHWDSPAVKEFPDVGRTNGSPAGPVRNASTAACQPDCTLLESTVASLNVPFFELTERLGPANVIDMASRAGIDSMWTDRTGGGDSARVDLRASAGAELVGPAAQGRPFSAEVGIGQYGITVLDHANGMATFAAGGQRASAHFVRAVYRHESLVYAEQLTQVSIGLSPAQLDELTAALSQVPSAHLGNGWDAAGKTGTWEVGPGSTANAHAWMVGYTSALAVAVWLGTSDGAELATADGSRDVWGSSHAAPIWRQFMTEATAAMALRPRGQVRPGPDASGALDPSPTPPTQ